MTTIETQQHTAARIGGADRILTEPEVAEFIGEQLAAIDADGRSVCVLVPDGTRTCPLPLLVSAVHRLMGHADAVRRLDARPAQVPGVRPEADDVRAKVVEQPDDLAFGLEHAADV